METNDKMPIEFQMALAHNDSALKSFLKMNDQQQNSIINEVKNLKTLREINLLVNNINKSH